MNIDIEKLKAELAELEPQVVKLWSEFKALDDKARELSSKWLPAQQRRDNIAKLIAFVESESAAQGGSK